MLLCELNLRGVLYPNAPYEVEVKYKGLRYIVRRGAIVQLIYATTGERAEPTALSRDDYESILELAKTNPVRIKESFEEDKLSNERQLLHYAREIESLGHRQRVLDGKWMRLLRQNANKVIPIEYSVTGGCLINDHGTKRFITTQKMDSDYYPSGTADNKGGLLERTPENQSLINQLDVLQDASNKLDAMEIAIRKKMTIIQHELQQEFRKPDDPYFGGDE